MRQCAVSRTDAVSLFRREREPTGSNFSRTRWRSRVSKYKLDHEFALTEHLPVRHTNLFLGGHRILFHVACQVEAGPKVPTCDESYNRRRPTSPASKHLLNNAHPRNQVMVLSGARQSRRFIDWLDRWGLSFRGREGTKLSTVRDLTRILDRMKTVEKLNFSLVAEPWISSFSYFHSS